MQAPDAEKKPLAVLCPEPLEIGPAPSTRWLREQELELRALLLRDARHDDRKAEVERTGAVVWSFGFRDLPDPHWPRWAALTELRLVERRLHQMGEDK